MNRARFELLNLVREMTQLFKSTQKEINRTCVPCFFSLLKYSLRAISSSHLRIVFIVWGVVLLLMTGCVTTSDSKDRLVDKDKALDSYITLGMAYLSQGDRDASRRNFEKALEIDRNSARAHNGMGLLYQLTGEVDLAEKSYKKSLSANKDYSDARLNFGTFLYQQSRYSDAIEAFERCAEDLTFRRRALALAYVGQTALKLNNRFRAKAAFQHALSLNKQLPLALIELAHISFEEAEYSKAKTLLDNYTDVAKATPRSLWLGIRIEKIFGNLDKEASYALALRNLYPYSKEHLRYKKMIDLEADKNE